MGSWLYDGDPFMHLEYQKTFDFLKEAVKGRYFERLILDYLLDNPHEAVIIVSPSVDQTAREEAALAEQLADYKASLSAAQVEALVRETKELKAYQEEPSAQEDLEKIPMLAREDIASEGDIPEYQVKNENGVAAIHTNLFTSGIGYLKVLFRTDRVAQGDLT